jgi:hypothetical protein
VRQKGTAILNYAIMVLRENRSAVKFVGSQFLNTQLVDNKDESRAVAMAGANKLSSH